MKTKRRVRAVAGIVLLFCLLPAGADELRIAVASNFSETLRAIALQFEAHSGHEVVLSAGSTGKHYAQIVNGAPFDLFFAADSQRPQRLEKSGLASHRFTYARGRLVLWSPDEERVDADGKVLERGDFRFIAIANPKLAPYGRAAQQVLEALGLWQRLSRQRVMGENVGQAFQFVKSGNAALGFVAFAQIKQPALPLTGSFWEVPQSLYTPIEQQAVLLKDSPAARRFFDYMRSETVRRLISEHGYHQP